MKAPRSTAAVIATGLGACVVGGAAGAYVGGRNGNAVFAIEGGVLGVLAMGFVGVVVAAASPRWRPVGEAAALVGVGSPLVLAAIGALKQHALSTSEASGAQTYNVSTVDSGGTQNMAIGDTLDVTLPSTSAAPTVSAPGVLATGATTPSTSGGEVVYSFVAVGAGTTTLSTAQTGAGQNGVANFTLTVSVST